MTVGEVVEACEYIGCDIVDFYGEKIELNQDNCKELYQRIVKHLDAKNNRVRIWTFDNMRRGGRMTVDELIKELQKISDRGCGEYTVYVYDECGSDAETDKVIIGSKGKVFIE